MEGIEQNREERIGQLESEVSKLVKEVNTWVKEGYNRSKITGICLQTGLRLQELILKMHERQFREDEKDYPALRYQTDVIFNLRMWIQLLADCVRRKLEKFQKSGEGDIAADEELQSSASMEHPEEAWPGYFTDDEGDGSKESSPIDFTHNKLNEEGHSSAAMGFSIAKSLGEAGSEVEDEIDLADETTEEQGMAVIDDAAFGLRVNREDLAREFEKKMTIAAREVQSTDVVGILGLRDDQKFKPIFLLVKKHLGPPPWVRGAKGASVEDKLQVRAWLAAAMADDKVSWNNLDLRRKVDERSLMVVRVPLPKSGLGLENQTGSFHFWKVSAYIKFGPNIQKLGPPPWPGTLLNNMEPDPSQINDGHKGKSERKFIDHLHLRPKSSASQTPGRSLDSPLPPLEKPPPKPPDVSPQLTRLELFATIVVFCYTSGLSRLTTLCLDDGVVGDDPGNSRFLQLSSFFDFNWASAYSLVDKSNFKGSIRAIITEGIGYECSFILPIPPERPSRQSTNGGSILLAPINTNFRDFVLLRLGRRKEAASIDSGDLRLIQLSSSASVIYFTHRLEGQVDLKGMASVEITTRKASQVVDESFVLPIPPEPPPHPWVVLGLRFRLSSKAVDCTPWQLSGRRKSDIDDPGLDTMLIDGNLKIHGQLVCELDNCMAKSGNKLGVEWNSGANQMVDLFYHCPRPPEFETKEEIPLNDRKGDERLIEVTCLQVQVEMVFADLLFLSTNWQGCISLDKWNLKLELLRVKQNSR